MPKYDESEGTYGIDERWMLQDVLIDIVGKSLAGADCIWQGSSGLGAETSSCASSPGAEPRVEC